MYENVPASQKGFVDLRSDTVTRPTPEMYAAMASAPLGDDVLGDEPTVAELEALSAKMTGMEAAVFVTSGTMGNQIALAAHCERGGGILLEEESHILYYECGAPGVVAQVVTLTIPSDKGVMDPADIERRVFSRSLHSPGTQMLCLENTHNRAGGTIIPIEMMAAYRELANRHGLIVHLDGARMFNASVALGVPVSEITKHVDSVSFCLSKGLASPVGSVLCGRADVIHRARQWRKRLGGGMRQSGLLAACGIVSLTQMVDRLADDHRRAKAIATGLREIPGLTIDWDCVQTNMVLITTNGPSAPWLEALHQQKILAMPPAPNRIRLVLHKDIDDEAVERTIDAFSQVSKSLA